MAGLTVLLVELRSLLCFRLIDGPKDLYRPGWRLQPGKCGRAGKQALHLPQALHIDSRTEEILRVGKIHAGTNTQGLANISHHGLLDRSVVLDPIEPARIPERR